MNEKSLIPSIRFAGFTDVWERRKLGEIAVFNPKEELPSEFEYVDLESVVGTEMLSHRHEIKQSAPSRAQRLARKGDLFYQMVRPYQKNNFLFEKDETNYVFSTGYAQIRPSVDGYFILSLVQGEKFTNTVLDNCTGTSYPAINANDLASIEVYVPTCSKEAYAVGRSFRQLDRLITLHQRKYEKLLNIKKSMLDKMFPKNDELFPEVRFAGFTDAWEQRKCRDVAPLQRGFDLPTNQMHPGKYPVVMSNGIGGYHSEYKAKGPGVVTGRSGTIGNLHYIEADYWPHNTALWVTDFKGNNPKFIYYLYQQFDLSRFGTGSGVPTLNRNDVHDALVFVPSISEQEKISNFFTVLDNTLTLHQRKLEKLQNIKKACLEKMFV